MKKFWGMGVALLLAVMILVGCDTQVETKHEHAWDAGTVTKESTCTADGEKTYTCKCGEKRTEKIYASHKWGNPVVLKAATCTENGKTKYTCSACGQTKEVEVKGGHKWNEGEVVTEATCTTDGLKKYTCSVCKAENTETYPASHTPGDDLDEFPATCTTDGSRTYTCTVCEQFVTETIQATGHLWDAGTVTAQAKCTEDGLKTFACSNSGCTETKTETIPATGHDWHNAGTWSPSVCRLCNESRTGVSLDALGALKVLQESELASYGITSSSVPAKIENAQYVTFGVYPQTIKASSVQVADGTAGINGGSAVTNTEISGADYYLGSDGNWYAKALENAVGEDYTYSDNTAVLKKSAISYKYFKVEPIVWRVLKDDSTSGYMILSEKILTADVAFYPYIKVNRTIENGIVFPNNYEHSRVRAFLNGLSYQEKSSDDSTQTENSDFISKGFLQQAFTTTQQNKIATTTVDNSAESAAN
ncbi:MAG: hypothetical protein HUK25_00980, partial [Treponema sp.]|nr:hypothetical protein [Treponema sp.]